MGASSRETLHCYRPLFAMEPGPGAGLAPLRWRRRGSKFSPLSQINTDNVDDLKIAWTYQHGELKAHPETSLHGGLARHTS